MKSSLSCQQNQQCWHVASSIYTTSSITTSTSMNASPSVLHVKSVPSVVVQHGQLPLGAIHLSGPQFCQPKQPRAFSSNASAPSVQREPVGQVHLQSSNIDVQQLPIQPAAAHGRYLVLLPTSNADPLSANVSQGSLSAFQQAAFVPIGSVEAASTSKVLVTGRTAELGASSSGDKEKASSSSASSSSPPPNCSNSRKAFHNQVERRRRLNINAQIAKIGSVLPSSSSNSRKVESISVTLERAIQFIEEMKPRVETIAELEQYELNSKAEVARLEAYVNFLKSKDCALEKHKRKGGGRCSIKGENVQ